MNRITMKRKYNGGYALITAVVFFLVASSIFIFGTTGSIIKENAVIQDISKGKEAYYLSESGTEDFVYRLNKGDNLPIGTSETLVLNNGQTTINVTDEGYNKKGIISSGNKNDYQRTVGAHLSTGTGVVFNYSVQSGTGGFELSGGSRIVGNVYSNGSIIGTDGPEITGSAFAANITQMIADQKNELPATPTNSINFGNANSSRKFAQSFIPSTTSPINKVSLYMKKVGNPSSVNLIIRSGTALGGSTDIVTGVLNTALLSTANYGWVDITFPSNPNLIAGTTYWLVIDSSVSASSYFIIGANSAYGNGQAKVCSNSKDSCSSSNWINTTPSGLDGYFRVYIGGMESLIGGGSYIGAIRIGGDAKAYKVQGAQVTGNLYCQQGVLNNKACSSLGETPAPQNMPVSEANILDWKDEALVGGIYNGNLSVGSSGTTTGPKKINGNLSVAGGGTLTVNGTLWVTGDLSITGGGKIRLASSYGSSSGVIVVEGKTSLSGGSAVFGSGTAGSFVMIVSTSNCDGSNCGGLYAITVNGGASAVILNAQNGTISLSGGCELKEVTGKKIIATGGTDIIYETGLANMTFISGSGPTGGYTIDSWGE